MAPPPVQFSSSHVHKRRKSSEDSGKSIQEVVFNSQPPMKGLGICGLTEERKTVVVSTTGDELNVTKEDISDPRENLTPYLPLDGSPSPPSPRSSALTDEVLSTPQTPSFSNAYSQYGSGLNKFKSRVQSPTPSRRKEDRKGNRPLLMRTPPSDHPISGIHFLSKTDDEDENDEDEDEDDLKMANEKDERRSSVAELPASPARLAFGFGNVPSSPSNSNSPNSPTSPNTLSPDRFHFRQSSSSHRIHSRNLSTFYPQPGQPGPPPSPGGGTSNGRFVDAPVTDIPYKSDIKTRRNGADSLKAWTFSQPSAQHDNLGARRSPSIDTSASALAPPPPQPSPGRIGRRGHHVSCAWLLIVTVEG